MFKSLKMQNNAVFNRLLHLTGLTFDNKKIIDMLKKQGVNANASKIKRWRTENTESTSYGAMPLHILNKFFDALFEEKKELESNNISLCNFDIKKKDKESL